ncbi:hypothetical protein diail_1553 [Diaporthe ilicicola]|nr:hypothetical protein diail_1553 [Diaporthe ilicicola]
MTRDQHSTAVITAQEGGEKRVFPFLELPPEIRNMIYQHILRHDRFITSLSPPALPLLRTSMQIRDEALGIYYAKNTFHLTLKVPAGQVLQKLQKFVDGQQNSIEMRVRHIIFRIDQRSSGCCRVFTIDSRSIGVGRNPYNNPLKDILGYLPFRFLQTDGEDRNPGSRWTDHSSAREEFIARALVLGCGVMFDQALELFDAVWMLADTFPKAKKWISTRTDLPLRFTYTAWL